MYRILASITLLALLTLILPMPAHAQTDEEKATLAFKKGVDAYENKNFTAAASFFREANALNFNWKLLYNIGQSEAAARRNGLALQAFEEYLTRAGDDISVARREEVIGEIQRLKLIVGMLEVTGPEGATVLIDGETRDRVPLVGPILISAGVAHEVTVLFDGEQIHQQTIRISGGNTQKITAKRPNEAPSETAKTDGDVPPKPSPGTKKDGANGASNRDVTAQSPPKPYSPDPGKRRLGPILMATGGAIVGAGLALGAVAYKKGTRLDDAHPNGVPDTKQDDVDQVNHLALTADILMPIGAAAAVTGFVIWMAQRKKAQDEQVLSAFPLVSPRALGAGLTGQF